MEGYQPVGAEHGRAGLDRLLAGLRPTVILLDLMMPVMDGWEFLAEKKRRAGLEQIPVVVITAAGPGTTLPEVRKVLPKPLDFQSLLDVVKELCPA